MATRTRDKKLIEQEQEGAIDLSIFDVGNYLVLSKAADDLGMTKFSASHFEDVIATDILSLAFYCVADEYCPLYQIVDWSADQYLPSEKTFTEGRIVQSLEAISESNISCFLKEFAELPGIYSKQFKEVKEALSAFRTKEDLKKQFEFLQYEGDVEDLEIDSLHHARSRLFIQLLAETLRAYVKKRLKEHEDKFRCEHIVDDWFLIIKGIQLIQVGNGRPYFKKFIEDQREILNFFRIDLKNRQWPDLRKLRSELY